MELKRDLAFIILGLFLFKIGIFDFARNFHHSPGRTIAEERSYDRPIR